MPAVLGAAHECQRHLVPRARHNSELTFVAVHAEILGRFVVCVECADRNDLHSRTEDGIAVKLLLQPELLQRYFAAAFNLRFVLSAFFLFNLDGAFRAAVLELNLRADAPALAEIVAQINDHVRQVELTKMVIGIFLGVLAIPQVAIAEKTMFRSHFSIAAYPKTSTSFGLFCFSCVGFYGVFRNLLRSSGHSICVSQFIGIRLCLL